MITETVHFSVLKSKAVGFSFTLYRHTDDKPTVKAEHMFNVLSMIFCSMKACLVIENPRMV